MRPHFSILVFVALAAPLVTGHAQARRQASTTSASSTSTTRSTTTTPPSVNAASTTSGPTASPPCCFFGGWAGAVTGVQGNWWYTRSAVQTIATIFSTILDYGDREEVANVSTSYIPADDIYTGFGEARVRTAIHGWEVLTVNSELARLGIPSTLIDKTGDYAATFVYPANTSAAYGVSYPTPFLKWDGVQLYYNATGLCDVEIGPFDQKPDLAYDLIEERSGGDGFYIQALPLDGPQPTFGAYPLPSAAIEKFLSLKSSAYPWMSDCPQTDTPGEPTVHIAVNQLTDTSRVTVRMGGPTTDPISQPTGGTPALPDTPSPAPPSEDDDEPLPVQTPAPPTEDDDGPVSVQPPANTQGPNSGSTPDTGTGASSPQNPTTGEQQSANPGETTPNNASPGGTISEDTSPDIQQAPASSNPQTPNANQDGQASPDNDGDDIPSDPTVVVPGESPASGTVQSGAQGQTAASESGDGASNESGSSKTGTDVEANGTTGSDDEDDEANGAIGSGGEDNDAPASNASSTTGDVGDAIMSGIGQTRTGSNGAGYTGPAYTGAAASLAAEIVGVASLGLTWLAWCCI